ncbi:MAG: FtsX-like permease family protein, partial [Acidobacteriota bacterium]
RAMGLRDPVGKRLSFFGEPGTNVGVAKEFHFQPLNFPVRPLILGLKPSWKKPLLFVRLSPERRAESLRAVEDVWKRMFPGALFYAEEFASRYRYFYAAEDRLEKVVGVFSALAVFVSCLGLFGLASFLAEQRTREVGIRKVLGASTAGVSLLLTKEFVKSVAAAVLVAWPAAYFVLAKWLQGYAEKAAPSPLTYLLAGAAALAIAVATVGFQAVRAARRNPAEAVRYE